MLRFSIVFLIFMSSFTGVRCQEALPSKWINPCLYSGCSALLLTPTPSEPDKDKSKDERDIRNLRAQESVADSTCWGVFVAFIQLIISAIGTVVLLWTVRLNKTATDAAAKTAEVALKALSKERAWLTYQKIEVVDLRSQKKSPQGEDLVKRLRIHWKNSGQSPAIKMGVKSAGVLTPYPGGPPDVYVPPFEEKNRSSVLGQGQSVSSNAIDLTDFQYQMLRTFQHALCIKSVVQYEDIFNIGELRTSRVLTLITYAGSVTDENGNTHDSFVEEFDSAETFVQ